MLKINWKKAVTKGRDLIQDAVSAFVWKIQDISVRIGGFQWDT
jgi:hypothetical protein